MMSTFDFKSSLALQIQHFIELRSLYCDNTKYQSSILLYFDRFLVQHGWSEARITCQLIDDYIGSQQHLALQTRKNRQCVVRQFCAYLAATDPNSYIPESFVCHSPGTPYEAYIYTLEDIHALMRATALWTSTSLRRSDTYLILLGLLYTTGIRIGEAIALNIQDFDRHEARLLITNGKFNKARWIPLASSVCATLSDYVERRCQCGPNTAESPLFINTWQHRLLHSNVNRDFHQLLASANVARADGTRPRLHDLRHTFAVNRLLSWYRENKDVNALLPALATYMGHVDIASTLVYLHPTKALLKQVNQRFHQYYLNKVKPTGEPR